MNDPDLIDQALEFAAIAHENQYRKGTRIPYVAHPSAVGLLLARAGCSDELIAAGILHDTVEDANVSLEVIEAKFGDLVASLVKGCSEPDKSLGWKERKGHTIESCRKAPLEMRIVSCADKLHNVKSMRRDYEELGSSLWGRFNRGRDDQKWYYRNLVESLCRHDDIPEGMTLFEEFEREVDRIFGDTSPEG